MEDAKEREKAETGSIEMVETENEENKAETGEEKVAETKNKTKRKTGEVVLCAILKNELDLCEWLAYHHLIGFDRFVLYDHDSSPSVRQVVERDIVSEELKNKIQVVDWPSPPECTSLDLLRLSYRLYRVGKNRGHQEAAYNDCLENEWQAMQQKAEGAETELAEQTESWVAFIDGDEFIALKKHKTIQEFLDDYAEYDCVALQWLMFSSSGKIQRAEANHVLESYTKRQAKPHPRLKRILKPRAFFEAQAKDPTVHMIVHNVGTSLRPERTPEVWSRDVDTLKQPVDGPVTDLKTNACTSIACIHHYHTRSLEDWLRRLLRGQLNMIDGRSMEGFYYIERKPHVQDEFLKPFAALVRPLLATATATTTEKENAAPKIIVSLTTTSYRIQNVHYVIESLLEQTVQPDKIILWLSKEPYLHCKGITEEEEDVVVAEVAEERAEADKKAAKQKAAKRNKRNRKEAEWEEANAKKGVITKELKTLEKENGDKLEICWVENTGPYRKLFPAAEKFSGAQIITVDDDWTFLPTMIEYLTTVARIHPQAIIANSGREVYPQKKYAQWDRLKQFRFSLPNEKPLLLPLGCGGILYPPGLFSSTTTKMVEEWHKKGKEIAPTTDDIWYRHLYLDRPVIITAQKFTKKCLEKGTPRLFKVNARRENEEAWQKASEYFGSQKEE